MIVLALIGCIVHVLLMAAMMVGLLIVLAQVAQDYPHRVGSYVRRPEEAATPPPVPAGRYNGNQIMAAIALTVASLALAWMGIATLKMTLWSLQALAVVVLLAVHLFIAGTMRRLWLRIRPVSTARA